MYSGEARGWLPSIVSDLIGWTVCAFGSLVEQPAGEGSRAFEGGGERGGGERGGGGREGGGERGGERGGGGWRRMEEVREGGREESM